MLGLLPGSTLTPRLIEGIVRLGSALPFEQASALLHFFTGVRVSAETVRRLTERAGTVQLALETAAVAQLERELPEPPVGPVLQQLSADGAMVPLVGGVWAEVKTLAIGTVTSHARAGMPRATDITYVARLSDAVSFGWLATGETQRRGTTTAGTVVAVMDGAVWLREFVDLQRPDAVRILDFPHAVEHLGVVAQAVFGPGTAAASEWLGQHAHSLRHADPDDVLASLLALEADASTPATAVPVVRRCRLYLAGRRNQIDYADFAAVGYPIGSGMVESANKLLVEARLKGSGMHWERANVNALLALRCLERNGRWDSEWPALWTAWRGQRREQRRQRRAARLAHAAPVPTVAPQPVCAPPAPPARPKQVVNGKPTVDHCWRHFALRHAKS